MWGKHFLQKVFNKFCCHLSKLGVMAELPEAWVLPRAQELILLS